MNEQQKVEVGYDQIADQYLATKDADDPKTLAALADMVHTLPPGGAVLDIGCGAGIPVARWLARRFAVTGVDVSARQVELARQHVPAGTFIHADMAALEFPAATFDAVVAFYSIIHVPRAEQPALLQRIYRWLKPGGAFLATWAVREWEGEEVDWEGWGAGMWWSHYGADENLEMLHDAGFRVESKEIDARGGETWLWVLARAARHP